MQMRSERSNDGFLVDQRCLAIDIIATLVNIKRTAADRSCVVRMSQNPLVGRF